MMALEIDYSPYINSDIFLWLNLFCVLIIYF